jgi:hypothetical protein
MNTDQQRKIRENLFDPYPSVVNAELRLIDKSESIHRDTRNLAGKLLGAGLSFTLQEIRDELRLFPLGDNGRANQDASVGSC